MPHYQTRLQRALAKTRSQKALVKSHEEGDQSSFKQKLEHNEYSKKQKIAVSQKRIRPSDRGQRDRPVQDGPWRALRSSDASRQIPEDGAVTRRRGNPPPPFLLNASRHILEDVAETRRRARCGRGDHQPGGGASGRRVHVHVRPKETHRQQHHRTHLHHEGLGLNQEKKIFRRPKLRSQNCEKPESQKLKIPTKKRKLIQKKEIPPKDVNTQKKFINLKGFSSKTHKKENEFQISSTISTDSLQAKPCIVILPNQPIADTCSQQTKRHLSNPKIDDDFRFNIFSYPDIEEREINFSLILESQNSNPGALGLNIDNIQEPDEVELQIKHVTRTYSRTKKSLPKTYDKDKPKCLTINRNQRVKKYKEQVSAKTKMQNSVSRTTSTNSNQNIKSNIFTVEEPTVVTPQIMHVSKAYSHTKKSSSKTFEKYPSPTINSSSNTVKIIDSFPQVKQCDAKTKMQKNESQTTSAHSDPDILQNKPTESNIVPIEGPSLIKYVQKCLQTKGSSSKTCVEKEKSQTFFRNSIPDTVETIGIASSANQCEVKKLNTWCSAQTKTPNNKSQLTSTNSSSTVFEPNISCAQKLIEVTPQRKHIAQTYPKEIHSKNNDFQGTFTNSSLTVAKTNYVILPVKELSSRNVKQQAKLHSTRDSKMKGSVNSKSSLNLENSDSIAKESNSTNLQTSNAAKTYPQKKDTLSNTTKSNYKSEIIVTNYNPNLSNTNKTIPLKKGVVVLEFSAPNVKQQAKLCSSKTRNSIPNSNPEHLELNFSCAKELKEVLTKIKPVVQTYTHTDKILEINEVTPQTKFVSPSISQTIAKLSTPAKQSRVKSQSTANVKRRKLSKGCKSFSSPFDSPVLVIHEPDDVLPQTAPNIRKFKKVCFDVPCEENLQSNSSIVTIDISSDSEVTMDYLPLITESCKNKLKTILTTAVEFQRHSHRQKLYETDFIKALSAHGYFKEDSDDDNFKKDIDKNGQFIPLFCQGKWLYR